MIGTTGPGAAARPLFRTVRRILALVVAASSVGIQVWVDRV